MSVTETVAIAPAGTWALDPVHSVATFEIAYLAGTFKGQFREIDARLEVDDERTTLTGTATVASVDVKDENLAAHLQSPDFFDAANHPSLRFACDDLRADGETVTGEGEITIKGVRRAVELHGTRTAPLIDAHGNERIGLTLSATVDRTDFGVDWNMPLPSGEPALAHEVAIVAELQLVRAA